MKICSQQMIGYKVVQINNVSKSSNNLLHFNKYSTYHPLSADQVPSIYLKTLRDIAPSKLQGQNFQRAITLNKIMFFFPHDIVIIIIYTLIAIIPSRYRTFKIFKGQ